jgi:hypothetical protein
LGESALHGVKKGLLLGRLDGVNRREGQSK